ncbi:MAG: MFS transporter [Nitrospirae bacterium]|nr:MFS transporter [Nitrospirota bacterium]
MKKSPLIIIFVTVFVDLLGFGIVIPITPFYAEKYGATALAVGLLMSSYSLMQLIFAPIWGRVSDRVGRRPIILMSLLGSTISYLIFGLADSLAVLFISRCFAGVFGANISTSQAYISDSTNAENRAKGMGLIGAAFGLGFVLGPLFGGYFSHYGYRIPAYLASVICGVNFFSALVNLPESRKPDRILARESRSLTLQGIKGTFSIHLLSILVILTFLITFAFSNLEATFALFAEKKYKFGSVETGYIFGFLGILMAVMQGGLIGRLAKKFGEKKLLVAGTILMLFGLVLIPFVPHFYLLVGVLVLLGFGVGINNPSLNSLISQYSDPHQVGTVMGVSQAMGSLARILGPMFGGYVYDRYGMEYPYVGAGIFMLVAIGMAVLFLNVSGKEKPGLVDHR